jgi:hypothetical protein
LFVFTRYKLCYSICSDYVIYLNLSFEIKTVFLVGYIFYMCMCVYQLPASTPAKSSWQEQLYEDRICVSNWLPHLCSVYYSAFPRSKGCCYQNFRSTLSYSVRVSSCYSNLILNIRQIYISIQALSNVHNINVAYGNCFKRTCQKDNFFET